MAFLIEFATVRELEKKSSRVFIYGGAGLFLGLVLIFTPLAVLGIGLTAISAIVLLGAIICVSALAKEQTRQLFCPYCASRNEAYASRREFDCDICRRPIIVSEYGEPLMAQPIDLTPRHNQKPE